MEQIKVSIESLAASVHARMAAFEDELKKDPATKKDTVNSISMEFQCFRAFVVASLGALQQQIGMLTNELDGMEMRSRRKMLLLHGVPEEKDEDTTKVVVAVANEHLSLPELQPEDIRRAHRMGRFSSASNKPRPVLVKFVNTKTRDDAWTKKVGLKGTGITVSEFLTQRRHKLFQAARSKLGITKCWTREGRIVYLAPDGKRHSISTQQDLDALVGESADRESSGSTGTPSQAGGKPSEPIVKNVPPKPAKTVPATGKKK
ncbi:hypothetical protein NE865_08745 [Phthorimaea operculella]|nr:hypothetical protein NE865_08745 [Phthorimaea operculella]